MPSLSLRFNRIRKSARKLRRYLPRPNDVVVFVAGMMVALIGVRLASHVPLGARPLTARGHDTVAIMWLPPTVERWKDQMQAAGKRYDIDPELLAIIMTVESGGNPKARSEAGARGLMQLMPQTAADIAKERLKPPRQQYDLEDPRNNIEFAAAYLSMLRDEFGEARHGPDWNTTVEYVAAGYNGGPGTAGALHRGEGLRDIEPVIYSRDVYNMWRERHAPSSPTYDRWRERGGTKLIMQAQTVL